MHFHTRLQAIAAGGVGLYFSSWADHSHINTAPQYWTNHKLPSAAVGVSPSLPCNLMNGGGEHMDKSSLFLSDIVSAWEWGGWANPEMWPTLICWGPAEYYSIRLHSPLQHCSIRDDDRILTGSYFIKQMLRGSRFLLLIPNK